MQQTRQIAFTDPSSGLRIIKRQRVWNYTVADIALLAFGTSFPQISLAIIDAITNVGNLYAGGLGPGTLVGSAACDLFLIHAMCVIIPKKGSVKKIFDLGVWVVELAWSFWAYIWLYIILLVWTPEVITPWEASLTVVQFFLLILHSYAQDQEWPFISISILDQQKRQDWISANVSDGDEAPNATSGEHSDSSLTQSVVSGYVASSSYQSYSADILDSRTMPEHDNLSVLIHTEGTQSGQDQETHTWMYIKILWKQQFHDVATLSGCREMKGKWLAMWNISYELLVLPWRFLFAFVPPHILCHGWATFCCSLVFITGISYIVTRLTNLISCVTGIDSYVIALTVLSTGSSWPDLVASMIAAHRQSTADSAIANIICSNSVNIYIGIGVPWVIDSFYNRFVLKQQLKVPSLELGFTLDVYFITSVLCVIILIARRYLLGGELGGPRKWAWATSVSFLSLWIIFLVLSCLRVYQVI